MSELARPPAPRRPRLALRLDRALRLAAMAALPGVGLAAWLSRADAPRAIAATRPVVASEVAAAPPPAGPPDTISGAGPAVGAAPPAAPTAATPTPQMSAGDPLTGPRATTAPRRARAPRVRDAVDLPLHEPLAVASPAPRPRSAPPRPPSGRVQLELVPDAPRWAVPDDLAAALVRRSATELRLSRAAVAQIALGAADLFAGTSLSRGEDGAVLERVAPGSLVERAGLESGDRIVAWSGRPIAGPDALRERLTDLVERVAGLAPGEVWVVRLSVERAGERLVLEIEIR
ncbi:MAG: hypothetical protein IT376_01460 [Polyangiaceae bacterium]|nr:hypothetical protein [Polyangiaceae bacterium]